MGVHTLAIVFFRTLIIYITLSVFMCLLGKRQLGELELTELIVALLIANLATLPLQDIGIPLLNGLLSIIILFCCELIVAGLTLKSPKMRAITYGKPSMLVEKGKINQYEMEKNRFTIDELLEELRNKSVTDISKVQYAVLETDGVLNTILSPGERPVTAAQMGVPVDDTGYPTILISDGRVLTDNLRRVGRDGNWLKAELKRQGVSEPRQVYLLTLNAAGQVYFAAKEAG
jgi:uncharacterized membrane protein YcaP (DUF421 family)